jgi:FdhE protein
MIEDLIRKKPHLERPLRFYERTLRFADEARSLGLSQVRGLRAYPPESAGPVIDRLSSALELPKGSLQPLRQALESGDIDFMRLPLGEVPAFSLPYAEDDLIVLLFILSRPFFRGFSSPVGLDGRSWNEGKCPACRAQPSLSSFTETGGRRLHCSFCGTNGPHPGAECPVCFDADHGKRNILAFESDEGFTFHACDACRSYVKIFDSDLLDCLTPDLADLASLPLDIAVQQKGYARRSPNPIGMMRMSANG